MPVDIGEILHVLAHELRTPVGIAHGYVRLLLEGRLANESEQRRAIEQLQKALSRLTDLSHESSALANWFERDKAAPASVGVRTLLDSVMTSPFESAVTMDGSELSTEAQLTTDDRPGLERALTAVVRSTLRELRGRPCSMAARTTGSQVDLLIGDASQFDEISAGPEGPHATPIDIGRGGLGLTLVHASVVLESHGAQLWCAREARQSVGVRLPLAH